MITLDDHDKYIVDRININKFKQMFLKAFITRRQAHANSFTIESLEECFHYCAKLSTFQRFNGERANEALLFCGASGHLGRY